jgi:hypothetical protein
LNALPAELNIKCLLAELDIFRSASVETRARIRARTRARASASVGVGVDVNVEVELDEVDTGNDLGIDDVSTGANTWC